MTPMTPSKLPLRRMTRSEYEKLAAEAFFSEDERIELVFGMVVQLSPIDPAHAESTNRIGALLHTALRSRARISIHSQFAATEDSEPQPDLFVFPHGDYWRAHPDRAYLVIEVARSSLEYDRGLKAKLYALSHVDEYWVVNHCEGVVEVFRDSRKGRWRSMTTYGRGETIAMQAFPDVLIAVDDIMPPID